MDSEEERITRKYGSEIFSFPPSVWDRIGANVRNGVMAWARSKRMSVSDDEYWNILMASESVLDDLGF